MVGTSGQFGNYPLDLFSMAWCCKMPPSVHGRRKKGKRCLPSARPLLFEFKAMQLFRSIGMTTRLSYPLTSKDIFAGGLTQNTPFQEDSAALSFGRARTMRTFFGRDRTRPRHRFGGVIVGNTFYPYPSGVLFFVNSQKLWFSSWCLFNITTKGVAAKTNTDPFGTI